MADPGHLTDMEVEGGMIGIGVARHQEEETTITGDRLRVAEEDIMIIMMMDGEEDMEEEVVAEDVVDTIDMMKTMVVAMTMEVHPEEKTRKTGFPIILSIYCLKMTPWPPEHCSSAIWSSTSLWKR